MSGFWINVGIEFGASVFGAVVGILGGFAINRRWERKKFEERLGEILPTIFFELKDNRKLLEDLYRNPSRFYELVKRFDTSNWDINREDVSRIESTELKNNITKIYFNLKHLNYLLDIKSMRSEKWIVSELNIGTIGRSIKRTVNLTKQYFYTTLERLEKELNSKYQQGYERIIKEIQKHEHNRR